MRKYQPIVIIGAPRSGTNMLRDLLCGFDGVSTWPCDEINYIWRHGNLLYPSDEIPKEKATARVKRYVLNQFDWVAKKYNASYVVEKTCANSLRVDFVNRVVPDAKFIYIVRDGVDVTGSAKLRWTAGLNIPYLLQKSRFVPWLDLPYYAIRYFWSRVNRLFSSDKRVAFWGPTLNNLDILLKQYNLNQICAIQWKRCVDRSDDTFSKIDQERIVRVRYEDFVNNPSTELKRILMFLGISVSAKDVNRAIERVSRSSIGKGRRALNSDELVQLNEMIADTMDRHGYH